MHTETLALRSIDIATDRQLHAIGDGNQYCRRVNGDWVLITNMGNGVDWQPSELWNARTGAVVPFASYRRRRRVGRHAEW